MRISKHLKVIIRKILAIYTASVYYEFPVLDEDGKITHYEIYLPRSEKAIRGEKLKENEINQNE